MKKIIFLTSLCLLMAGISFAEVDLADALEDTALSSGVNGFYNSDGQAYLLQTGHEAGTRVYGSGSFATTISYQEVEDTTSELITSDGTAFDSAEFDSGTTDWTPIGEKAD